MNPVSAAESTISTPYLNMEVKEKKGTSNSQIRVIISFLLSVKKT